MSRLRLDVVALYVGGFLGPFGSGVVSSMLPELRTEFQVSDAAAAWSLTAYLVPFAGLMLISGTLGAHWGIARSVRVAYVGYLGASVLCAVTTWFPLLLAGRVLQGAANAFTSPLLLAAVASITPKQRLGRALGLFGSLQAAGQTSAPLFGGLVTELSWRWAFVGVAVAAAVLAVVGVPVEPDARPEPAAGPGLSAVWRPAVLRVAIAALVGWGCLGGLSFLVAFRAEDVFALGASGRGLLLTGFGVASLLGARVVGRMVDRLGARRCAVAGSMAGAVPIALVGMLPWLPGVAVLWALSGIFSQFVLVGLNVMALAGDSGNPGGAVSVVQAFRFAGAACVPALLGPLYHVSPTASFLLPAGLLALAAPVVLVRRAG